MADSTILVRGEGWKFKAAIGLGGLAVIVILAFLYRLEVGLIVLAIGSAVGARVWVWAIHQHKLADFERRRLEAETKKLEYEADKLRIARHFLEFNTGVFHIGHKDEVVEVRQFYPAVQASKPLADLPPLLPAPEPPLKRLLDIDFIHMLIRGPSGSGKTTVGNWLIDNAKPDAAIYVLDPHASQNASKGLPWSPRAEVIGDGRDWRAIDVRLQGLMTELDRRYKVPGEVARRGQRYKSSSVFQEILIVSDEWLAVLEHCPHAREFFETVGSEARKVDMRLIVMTIAATVDDLKCSAAVRDNLVELRLDHGLKAQNRGELRWGRGNIETVELPGRYRAYFIPPTLQDRVEVPQAPGSPPWGEAVEPVPEIDAGPVPAVPTADELKICELWDGGTRSLRGIHAGISEATFGGRQAEEIKEVLRRFGRVE